MLPAWVHSQQSPVQHLNPLPAGAALLASTGVSRYAIGDHVVSSFVSTCGRCHYCGVIVFD